MVSSQGVEQEREMKCILKVTSTAERVHRNELRGEVKRPRKREKEERERERERGGTPPPKTVTLTAVTEHRS